MKAARPQILCLTAHDLDLPEYGAVIRTRNIFHALAQIGDVRIVLAGAHESFARNGASTIGGLELLETIPFHRIRKFSIAEHWRHEFDARFLKVHKFQAAAGDREKILHLAAAADLVWIHSLRTANGFDLFRWPHSVLDLDDLPSDLAATSLAGARNPLHKLRDFQRLLRWRNREKVLAERFDALCVCSEPDRRKLGGGENIFVVPNGFSAPKTVPRRNPASPPRVGFVGTLYYPPNRDGVRWFLESVWPLILRQIPDARLRLAGVGGAEIGNGSPNVDRLGWLAEVGSEMAGWSLAVVPLFAGGGTRVKIAEAFSRKCPVVSTKLGAYGYDVADGRELLLADAPEEFAAKCLRILTQPDAGRVLAENAWQKFIANWTWDVIARRVVEAAGSVLQKKDALPD